ncbi:serine hydrolase FSH [Xylariomycetidae sp. FL0641]|nr:serine hydrolase FSH [Xylariomycetidae sp. FL0641]
MGSNLPDTTALPRILCLHGGGTNARIFTAQCRVLSRFLAPHFRLVFAEAPFASAPGPDVLSVYAADGPFKRWLRWLESHTGHPADDGAAVAALDGALGAAMRADPGTGPWVGLLGFSQGAKLAASLLLRQQQLRLLLPLRAATTNKRTTTTTGEEEVEVVVVPGRCDAGVDWKFAVLLAGRAPLVNLAPWVSSSSSSSLLSRASQTGLEDGAAPPDLMEMAAGRHVVRAPTVHVHGLADPGLHLHRELLEQYCDPEAAVLVEWDGAHRVPLKATDVQPLVDAVLEVARRTGALKE